MSRHYFPSVLDDFDKQLIPSDPSEPTSNHTEAVTKTIQQIDPK